MPPYELSKEATSDLEGIFRYTIKQWGEKQAKIYSEKLLNENNRQYLLSYTKYVIGLDLYELGQKDEAENWRTDSEKHKFDYLKKIIALAEINNIDLRLFISPVHAYLLEAMRVMGLWPIYEQWKRDLVASLPTQDEGSPSKPTIQLWDFSGYNTITTENYPSKNNPKEPMQGFMEPAHYKKQVGDMILDRIFDHQNANQEVPEDFGIQLKNENLEDRLAKIREDRIRYQKTHRKEIEKIGLIGKEIRSSENNVPGKNFRSMISCQEMS